MLKKLDIGTSEIEQVEAFNALVDAVNELQHDNSEKANCQENVLTMVDNQVTANLPNIDLGELAFLSKENTELKDEIDRLETKLERMRKAFDKGMEHITGLNNMIESWYKLLQSDKDTSTKYAILKSAISAYVENKGGDNE